MVTGLPVPEDRGAEDAGEGNLGTFADQLINSGKIELPSSPIAMMPFSSPTLQGSKTRMASTYLQQHPEEMGGSSLHITRSGVVVAGLSPASRSMINPDPSKSMSSQDEGKMTSEQMSTEAKGDQDGQARDGEKAKEKKKAFESDVKMIKGRKGTTAMADRAVNNRRRLEANHQKERELRRQAMQAVRQINRRQLQTGAVGAGHSASSSPMPALKQILPQKTDIHKAHTKLLKGRSGHRERIKASLREG